MRNLSQPNLYVSVDHASINQLTFKRKEIIARAILGSYILSMLQILAKSFDKI